MYFALIFAVNAFRSTRLLNTMNALHLSPKVWKIRHLVYGVIKTKGEKEAEDE